MVTYTVKKQALQGKDCHGNTLIVTSDSMVTHTIKQLFVEIFNHDEQQLLIAMTQKLLIQKSINLSILGFLAMKFPYWTLHSTSAADSGIIPHSTTLHLRAEIISPPMRPWAPSALEFSALRLNAHAGQLRRILSVHNVPSMPCALRPVPFHPTIFPL